MKLRSDLNLYVIGLRRFAEVRVGKKPPIPHTTSFSKVVPVTRQVWHTGRRPQDPVYAVGYYTNRTVEKKCEFKQTTWSGGRVLGPISSNSLANMGISVARDKIRQVPASKVKKLMEYFNAA